MFKIKNECSCCKYDVNFLYILEPFIELSKDIMTKTSQEAKLIDIVDFSIIDKDYQKKIYRNQKDNFRLKKEISRKSKNSIEKKREYLQKNEEEYEQLIFESEEIFEEFMAHKVFDIVNLEFLNKTGLLFILKLDKKFVSLDERYQNSINTLLSRFGVINNFQALLKEGLLKSSTTNFCKFDRIQYYHTNTGINTEKLNIVYCPIIEYSFIDQEKIQIDYCEKDDVWVNVSQLKKQFNIDIQLLCIELVKLKGSNHIIGLHIDNYFLSFDFDIKSIIYSNKIVEFYWLLIKRNVYRQQPIKSKTTSPSSIEDFKITVRKESFINVLSNLKKNLYLQNSVLDPEFEVFFDSMLSLSDLKHIEGYEFYVPDVVDAEKSIFGIYQENRKPNESQYNLIHWITNKDNRNYNHFHDEGQKSKQKNLLKALKPEISFYFRSKFFEDYLDSILKELELEYTSNYNLILKDETAFEIDFIVYVNSTLYFIEAKTKMSSYYIDTYEKKCNKILDNLNGIEDKVKFILISAFSDKNCEQYKYYIEKSVKPELNVNRPGLATKTYHFDVPIQSHAGHEITCISEPVYDNLKTIISNICLH